MKMKYLFYILAQFDDPFLKCHGHQFRNYNFYKNALIFNVIIISHLIFEPHKYSSYSQVIIREINIYIYNFQFNLYYSNDHHHCFL